MSGAETSGNVKEFSPVAVVGLACRLPGANDPDEFWRLLSSGGNAIGTPSSRRLSADPRIDGLVGGFLDHVDEFDAEFFGIAPREAIAMDPQQRLLLELAWEATEDANIPMTSLRGTDTGVFVAAIASDYAALVHEAGEPAISRYTLTGLSRGVLANRISYAFGLHGASLALDSAQSSGLAAVHAACASIGSGESTAAFVAAANLNLTRTSALTAQRFGGVSTSGRASVFDADADGYVRGEGAVVLLLKSLDRARADADRIHAVIRSTALNNDGESPSLTVPTAAAQVAVIERALRRANLRASDIQYVELHGTGTRVGDPIEAQALGIALGLRRSPDDPLPVGSVKPNVGHLEGAAGLVGLLKAIVSVRNREIPPTLHHERPNPEIDLSGTNIRVVTATEAWPHADRPLAAGVSSFGMGGTNAHVIVGQAPADADSASISENTATPLDSVEVSPYVVSGASPGALRDQAARLAAFLTEGGAGLGSIASGLVRDRVVFGSRAVVLATDRAALIARLTGLAQGRVQSGAISAGGVATRAVGVVFGGQGTQRAGAGAELYQRFPVFRAAFDAAVAALDRHLAGALVGYSVRDVAFGVDGADGLIDSTVYTQSVVFAVETALYRLLRSWGIEISAVAGHSIGGVVAAHVAGVLSLEDAARLVAARGRLMGSLPAGGAMVAVEATEVEVREAISEIQGAGEVSVAAVNAPRAVVISGAEASVSQVASALSAVRRRTKRLAVSHAFHSSLMDPVLAEFGSVVAGLSFADSTELTVVSDATGAVVTGAELADPAYWVRHLRGTVHFADAVRSMRGLGVDLFIEIGADTVLAPMVSAVLDNESDAAVVTGTLRKERDEATAVLTAAATVFTHGHPVDWKAIVPETPRIPLPYYAFQRQRFWLDTPAAKVSPPVGASAARRSQASKAPSKTSIAVADAVIDATAAVLGYPEPSRLDPQRTYKELGLDSLGASELGQALSRACGIRVGATAVYDFPTPAALIEQLEIRLSSGAEETTGPGAEQFARRPSPAVAEPIAIVAMSGRFPGGAGTPERLWDLVARGGDATGDFPADRGWDLAALYDPSGTRSGSSYARRGGFLTDAGYFDAAFFGISPREAAAMDPQQRLLLEAAWELFERAGIVPESVSGSRTAVYIGATPQEYGPRLHQMPEAAEGYGLTGTSPSVLSGRIAYTFGLAGPAVTVDTACSSSLVALHLAVRSLRSGEADLAIAGGVTVMANPGMFTEFSRQRGLASDGRCKAFAASADGTGWAEAVSLLLVERLSDARRLGHEVLALVRGSAVNQDGASNGLTAPNGPAQQRVIRDALADAGLRASEVDVVEAHGTGTALGDPIEAEALLATYGQDRVEPLWLGSLKSNIGHAQAAAGAAGVTKTVLALRNELIPATLHMDEPSPQVDWSSGAVRLATEPRPWPRGVRPRRAGISSFGISGTNAHVIIEEAPGAEEAQAIGESDGAALPFVISGASPTALRGQAQRLVEASAASSRAVLASSLVRDRAVFGSRAVVTAEDDRELVDGLTALAQGRPAPNVIIGPQTLGNGRVAVVFGGQGSQRAGAGAELYERFPVFRAAFDAAVELLDGHLSDAVEFSIRDVALGVAGTEGLIDSTVFTQPVVFAVETALYRLIESWGIDISVVAGHSIGGVVAAHVAGALTLSDAARLVGARARLMGALPSGGAMVAVEATENQVLEVISRLPVAVRATGISVAAVNGPRAVVVSGAEAAVRAVAGELSKTGSRTKRLAVSHGFHSPLMDPVLAEFEQSVAGLTFGKTDLLVVSDSTGAVLTADELADPRYWLRHLRGTVRFADAVRTMRDAGADLFLEVGADAVLTPMVSSTLEDGDPTTVAALRTGRSEVVSLFHLAATVFTHGHTVDWGAIVPNAPRTMLPTYAFQRERYWIDTSVAAKGVSGRTDDGWFWDRVRDNDADALGTELGIDADQLPLRALLPALDAWRTRRDHAETLDSWTYQVDWQSISLGAAAPERGAHWLLVSPVGGTADRWTSAISTALQRFDGTASTILVDPTAVDRVQFAAAIAANTQRVTKIVSLLPLATGVDDPTETATLAASAGLAQAVAELGLAADVRMITTGGVLPDDPVRAPLQAWHAAFAGAAAAEGAIQSGGLVDVPAEPDEWLAARLVVALSDTSGERELAVRERDTWAKRLVPARLDDSVAAAWRPTGTVLITGGTGALGARVARRLARNGVTDLLLVSRRGLDAPGARELLAELDGLGAHPRIEACDVGDRSALAALLSSIPADRPLTDVVHTAAVLDDALVDGLDRARIDRVHRVKVGGALNLHELTADRPLSSFVLFSSITGTVTAPGQSNYGPGNAFLDAFAEYRRSLGLPATAIAWGHWAGAGIAGAETETHLRRSGLRPMDPELAVDALERARTANRTRIVIADVDWDAAARPSHGRLTAELLPVADAAVGGPIVSLAEQIAALDAPERERRIAALVRDEVAATLGHNSAAAVVDDDRSLRDQGFTSLSAVELRNRLQQSIAVALPATVVFDHPTVPELTEVIVRLLVPEPTTVLDTVLGDLDRIVGLLAGTGIAADERVIVAERLRRLADVAPTGSSSSRAVGLSIASDDDLIDFIDTELGIS